MSCELKHVDFAYRADAPGNDHALADICLRVEDGTFLGIMGRTGCGKSTLVQIIAGLLEPSSGQVLVDGQDINASGYDRRILRQTTGVVFQYPEAQLFAQSVQKDVEFGLAQLAMSAEERRERVRWALDCVGFAPDDVLKKHPLGLSGGERRRVAIAGVLALRPKLLILDEPIAGLDPDGRRSLMDLLSALNAQGTTVLMVSHNADCLAEYAQRIIVLDAGRIALDGTPREVFRDVNGLRDLGVGVSQARAVAYALEKSAVLADDDCGVVSYEGLLDALVRRFGAREMPNGERQ